MFKLNSLGAKTSRSIITYEIIQLVRKERGMKARGDVVLKSAQIALKFRDTHTAHLNLLKFLSIVENLTAEHRAILEVECGQVLSKKYTKLEPTLKIIFILIYEILLHLMTFKHPPICILQENLSFLIYVK